MCYQLVITCNPHCFKDEKRMAHIVMLLNNLAKYDLKPVADNITNTNINIVAEKGKVKELTNKIRASVGDGHYHG